MTKFFFGKISAAMTRIAEKNRQRAELTAITNLAMAELGSPLTMEEYNAIVDRSTKDGWTLRKHLMRIQNSASGWMSSKYTHLARFYIVKERKIIRVAGFSW